MRILTTGTKANDTIFVLLQLKLCELEREGSIFRVPFIGSNTNLKECKNAK